MKAGRPSGARGGEAPCPLSAFVRDDGGYTTVAVAVALLMSLSLVFGLATLEWASSRSADVQAVADASALAGANVVAAYSTVAQVVDACVLSMGLLGSVVCGAGLVIAAIPPLHSLSAGVFSVGRRLLDARRGFARSASEGLSRLEAALPSLIMANSASCVSANSKGGIRYMGIAVPFPQAGESDFSTLDDGLDAAQAEEDARKLAEASARKQAAHERAEAAKERAWRADNVDDPHCLQSRAASLAGLAGGQNPSYPESSSWRFDFARLRSANYYLSRWEAETESGSNADELQRSCARKVFFRYAYERISEALCVESEELCSIDLPELPHTTAGVRETTLYTDAIWPCTMEDGVRTLHCSLGCPGAQGPYAGLASLADIDAGAAARCPICCMDSVAMGNVADASTNIPNGYEHYWRIVVEASREYQAARGEEVRAEREMQEIAERADSAFDRAMKLLSVGRPKLCPPGAYGCVSVVSRPDLTPVPSSLSNFVGASELPRGVAVSAAALAPDEATDGHNVLSSVFEGIAPSGGGLVLDLVGGITGVWGRLLVSYGSSYESVSKVTDDVLDGMGGVFGEKVASWLRKKISTTVASAGFEPADMRLRKPVLVNSQQVLDRAGLEKVGKVRELVQALPMDPRELLGRCAQMVSDELGDKTFTVAELPVPGMEGTTVPLTIDLGTILGALT